MEQEYQSTLEEGGKQHLAVEKQARNVLATNKVTAGSILAKKSKMKEAPALTLQPNLAEPNSLYCQPTSSKVKMEDLVTEEQEQHDDEKQASNTSH
jgi:hypothetical protein